jgi:hypothetical protein
MVEHPVPLEDYRVALQKLLLGWKMHTNKGVEVAREDIGVLSLVYPWVAQAHRYGAAAIRLDKQGYGHECHVLVRSALEHALMGHWVRVTGDDGVDAWYAEDHRKLKAMLTEAQGRPHDVDVSTWDLDLLAELVEVRKPAGANETKVLQKIDQVCTRLGLGATIYPAYRIHSWYAHPTTHTAGLYIEQLDDGSWALRDVPSAPPEAALAMMAHCVYWARRVLDDMTTGRPYEEWLDEIAAAIQVRVRLPDLPPD